MTTRTILFFFLAAALPALGQEAGGADEMALRKLQADIVDAYNHQDVDRLLEYFHPEVA